MTLLLLVAVAAAGAVALVALAAMVDARRTAGEARRTLDGIAHRLDPAADDDPSPTLAAAVARLGRADEAVGERARADGETRARLQRALGVIPEGVVVADETGEVVFRNAVAEAFVEARHADALVQAAVDELVAEAVADGTAGSRTLQLFGPPRRTVVVEATPLLEGGAAVGAMAVIEDVTERRRLEAVRRDFVANISHELKTPVGALSLLAETLAREDDPDVTRRLADRMVTEAMRVAQTIEDLIELSRIEAEEEAVAEPVPVAQVVAEAADRIRPAAEQAGIPVVVEAVDPALTVVGDRRQLVSALSNLLDNAVKYSDEGRSVEVRVEWDDGMLALEVADHGIGIPARDLDRIFERFYRVDQARSRSTGGTGLGLAIVRHVAANHHGEVRVRSRLGEGSVFALLLPPAPPAGLDADPARQPAPADDALARGA